MIKLRIKIKAEATSFSKLEFLDDEYNVSKTNPDLFRLVEKAIEESNIQEIDEVNVTAQFEW